MSGVFKTWMMRAETGKDGTTKVIASTPSVDRYGDVVAPDWKLERFAANPVVVWSHDYNLPPVGKVTDLSMDGDSLIASIKWDDSEPGSLGATVSRQFREGFLSAVSVGFAPTKSTPRQELPEDHPASGKSGQYLTGNELLEISAVSIPANPEAVAIRAKMWGLEADPIQRHILNVTEDEDTVTITMAKEHQEPEEDQEQEAWTRDVDMTAPKGVVEELRRGIEWYEEGLAGDGLKPETVRWARRLASGEPATEDKIRKMSAWLARHASDAEAEGFRPDEEGYPTPGRVAWALWGGDPAITWSARVISQLEDEQEEAAYHDDEEDEKKFWRALATGNSDTVAQNTIEATVRATLLDLLGYDSQVQEAVDSALTDDPAQEARDGWADLFDND